MISRVTLDAFDFDCSHSSTIDGKWVYNGVTFDGSQISRIKSSDCSEIKAEKNVVIFVKNTYYKYETEDGKEHYMACTDGALNQPFSEVYIGHYDAEGVKCGTFWRIITGDPAYISLTCTKEEQIKYLEDAAVKKGFFTIHMGNKTAKLYYSSGETPIYTKERYDTYYEAVTSIGCFFHEYEVGSIFTIGEKEYVLSENYTLDIPYGEDVYHINYPDKNLKCKNRQEDL